jgi:hypothetical protein
MESMSRKEKIQYKIKMLLMVGSLTAIAGLCAFFIAIKNLI